MIIPEHYRLALLRPDGTLADSVDVAGLCTRSATDGGHLIALVDDMVRLEAAKVGVAAERARRG